MASEDHVDVRQHLTANAFINNRNAEVIEWVFMKLDELYYPLTSGVDLKAVEQYHELIEQACRVFREEPNPKLIWQLRRRAITELGEAVKIVGQHGTRLQCRYVTNYAYSCTTLLAYLPTGTTLSLR